jgi:LPXTG-motif cell wall-anchored protein
MSVSAEHDECTSTADKGMYSEIPYCDDFDYCDRVPAIAYAQNGGNDNGYECDPDPECPFNPSIPAQDPNCVVTTQPPAETTVPPETTLPPEEPITTTTEVGSAGPVAPAPAPPAPAAPTAPAVLPATGSSDLPLVIAGSMAVLLGLGMVHFARSGAR